MRYHRTAIAIAALAVAMPVGAQEGLDLSASVRLRYETIDNQPRPGFNRDDDLISLRTILTAQYRTGPLRFGAEIYDSRVFGDDPGTPVSTNDVNTLELLQAWVATEIEHPLGDGSKLDLKLGRYTLNLGSRRLVAADDFRNTTNGYTGVRADLTVKGANATAIYVLPQIRLPEDRASIDRNQVKWDRETFNLVLWGGQVALPNALGSTAAEIAFYHLGEGDAPGRPTRDRSLDSLGVRLIRDPKPGLWDHEFEVIGQWGDTSLSAAANAPRVPVAAWLLHADAGYTFAGGWKPRISAEFDYVSGEGQGRRIARFDSLFGFRRPEYAPAGLYSAIGRANILSPGLRIEAVPSKRVDISFSWRPLWLASRTDSFSTTGVRDPAGLSGRYAGHQTDVRVRWWVVPERLRFEFNGDYLVKGRFLKTAPNRPAGGNSRYLAFSLTQSF